MKVISLMLFTCLTALNSQPIARPAFLNHDKNVYPGNENTEACMIYYPDSRKSIYLKHFREEFDIMSLFSEGDSDIDRVLATLHWSNRQWQHNGSNPASSQDAFTILEEARAGKNFRCTEYALVFAAAASSAGLPARTLDLRTMNCETAESSAGHSAAEVYLPDLQKWVFVDPQNDVAAFIDNVPLNAFELKRAIAERPAEINIIYKGEMVPADFQKQVIGWLKPYLYFLEVPFDNSYDAGEKYTCGSKTKLMLVPPGENAPEVFQKKTPLDFIHVTYSPEEFYGKPVYK